MTKTVDPQPDSPPTRLVIRIKLPPQGQEPPAPVRRHWSRVALPVIAVAVAVALGWWGISTFRTQPTPAPVVTEAKPSPAPAPQPPVAAPEPEVQEPVVTPALPINEVIPDVSVSARDTIRGIIRVSIRVTIDKEGKVAAATVDEPGPSPYFLRISLEAARKWTFAPTDSEAQRVMLLRFYFRRSGTTANAERP